MTSLRRQISITKAHVSVWLRRAKKDKLNATICNITLNRLKVDKFERIYLENNAKKKVNMYIRYACNGILIHVLNCLHDLYNKCICTCTDIYGLSIILDNKVLVMLLKISQNTHIHVPTCNCFEWFGIRIWDFEEDLNDILNRGIL